MSEVGSPSNVVRLLVGGAGTAAQAGGATAERRQADWERQIETLDHQEMELHQTQLKLIREQTATFIRDLHSLRQEVNSAKNKQAGTSDDLKEIREALGMSHGKLSDTVQELKVAMEQESEQRGRAHGKLEKTVNEGLGKHAQLHQDVDRKLKAQAKAAEDLMAKHGDHLARVQDSLGKFDFHQGTLDQRLDNVVKDVEIMVAKQVGDLQSSMQEARAMIGGDQLATTKDLQAHHATVGHRLDSLEKALGESSVFLKEQGAHHATMAERLGFLEKSFGDSFERHAKELEAAHKRLEQLHGKVNDHHALLAHHATMKERIEYIEKAVGDSADQHAEALAKLAEIHGRVSACEKHGGAVSDLQKDKALKEKFHASLQDRVDYLEHLMGDSAEKHAAALSALQAAHEKHAAAFSRQSKDFDAMRSAHAHQVSVAERLDYVERLLGDSADKHGQELAAIKAAHDKLHGRLVSCEAQGSSLGKSHNNLANEKKALMQHHATMKERIDYVEGLLGDSADRHAWEIEALKAAHDKHSAAFSRHSKDFDALKAAHVQHATVGERVGYLEKFMGDSADKHNEELSAAKAKLEQMHGRLSACERFGGSIDDLRRSHEGLSKDKKDRLTHYAGMKDRVDYLESLMGDSADKHAQELEALKDSHNKHVVAFKTHAKAFESLKTANAHHASVAERLYFLEKLLGDSADKHDAELAAARAKLEALHGRVTACEGHGCAISELQKAHAGFAGEKMKVDSHHASVQERMNYVEKLLGDSADKHAGELKALREAHAKHGKEVEGLKAAQVHHATFGERLSYVEKLLGDSADRHATELAAAQSKLELMHNRLSACESQGAALADLKRAHTGLASARAALETHHVSLKERVDYVEGFLGDSTDKHARALEAAHAKLEQMHGRVAACERSGAAMGDLKKAHADLASGRAALEVHHASMQERVDYLESMLGDTADKHAKALEALKSSHDKHTAIITSHAKDFEALKAVSVVHASLPERMTYLEGLLGDSADKHGKELQAIKDAYAKVADAHGKQSKDVEALKVLHAHHASMGERLGYLERVLGDSADKHAQEIEALKAAHAKHADVLTKIAKGAEAASMHHAGIQERIAYVEKVIGDSADGHAAELATIKALHDKHTKDLAATKDGNDRLKADAKEHQARHLNLAERLDLLEKRLREAFAS